MKRPLGGEPAALREFAQAAEEIDYHGIAAPDHVLGANVANCPVGPNRAPARSLICFSDISSFPRMQEL